MRRFGEEWATLIWMVLGAVLYAIDDQVGSGFFIGLIVGVALYLANWFLRSACRTPARGFRRPVDLVWLLVQLAAVGAAVAAGWLSGPLLGGSVALGLAFGAMPWTIRFVQLDDGE